VKILLDISTLGIGHVLPQARSGVFRVAEHTAVGLRESGECELRFSASQGYLLECLGYLQATPLFTEYRMYPPYRALPLLGALFNRAPLGAAKSHVRFAIAILLRRLLGSKVFFAAGSPSASDQADIYHSPLHAIPEWIDYRKLKVFQTIHDLIPVLYPQFFLKFRPDPSLLNALAALTFETNILCVSQSTKNDLCNHMRTIDPGKVSVLPLAASEEFYECSDKAAMLSVRRKYGIPAEAVYFLSVSTLEPRKNIALIIKSFVRILQEEKRTDLYLVLTGAKGWKYAEIFSELAKAEEFLGRIILTGYVPDENLAPLYSDALAFVYPSFYEGFGLPPLEAMQCGTPVITSDTSSLPEVVGEAGIMVKPTDGDALCQAMLSVSRDAELRDSMKRKSIARAGLFSWQRYTQELLALYKKAL